MQETQEMWVQSLGREDLLEEEMAPHSYILAWKILWTEEAGRLQSKGSQRIRHDLAHTHTLLTIITVLYITCLRFICFRIVCTF